MSTTSSNDNTINTKLHSNYPSNLSNEAFQSNSPNLNQPNNFNYNQNPNQNQPYSYQYTSQIQPNQLNNPQSYAQAPQLNPYTQNQNQSQAYSAQATSNYNSDPTFSQQQYQSILAQNQPNNNSYNNYTQNDQAYGTPGFYSIPMEPEATQKKSDNILTRSANFAELKNELDFDGNVRQYYLKYIDNNSALMPLSYRRKIDFLNKINLIVPVACVFNMIMASANYIPENPPLAKKHFFFSTLVLAGTIYFSRIFVKQYQIQSFNELLGKYSESEIKEMVDKSIMINRNL